MTAPEPLTPADVTAEDWRDRYETLHGFVVDLSAGPVPKYMAARIRAALAQPEATSEPLWFKDQVTGEPCPTDGLLLCSRSDWKTHRHVDGRATS